LDTSFDPGSGVGGSYVHCLQLEPDGKIIIGGNFSTVNGLRRSHVARLLPNGLPDADFDPELGPSSEVLALARQSDGKILIGGGFTSCNRISRPRLARLNQNGSLDESFNPEKGPNGEVRAILTQPDGKILVGGCFTRWNQQTNRSAVVRLNVDGSLDSTFNAGSGPQGMGVFAMALQADGKVWIGGEFTGFSGAKRGSIARLNADGSMDEGFNPDIGFDGWIGSILLQPDGRVVIAGDFNKYITTPRARMARLEPTGALDTSFNPGKGFDGISPGLCILLASALQKDGKILVGGLFGKLDGQIIKYFARLNADGTPDVEFKPKLGDVVRAIGVLPDDRIVVGGTFKVCGGIKRACIAQFKAFPPPTGLLSVPSMDASGTFACQLRGASNGRYQVEWSEDLISWNPQIEVSLSNTAACFIDPRQSDSRQRFYRLLRVQ
jgi:uncharacterized delta-60 repeat protein